MVNLVTVGFHHTQLSCRGLKSTNGFTHRECDRAALLPLARGHPPVLTRTFVPGWSAGVQRGGEGGTGDVQL